MTREDGARAEAPPSGAADHSMLTRRAVLRGAAAAGAASLVRPGAGIAGAGLPRARRRVQPLGRDGRGRVADRRSRTVCAGRRRVGGAGARDDRASDPVREGAWGPWAVASVLGHGPDRAPARAAHFGEPIWSGPADYVQLRSSRTVWGVRLHFVAARPSPPPAHAAQAFPLAQPVLDAGPGQPPIIARSAWAQGHAPPSHVPLYGTVKLAFVHHSDDAQRLRPRRGSLDPPVDLRLPPLRPRLLRHRLQLRGRRVRPDLGGASRRDRPGRVGAHAGGYNKESTGMVVLGTFMDVGALAGGDRRARRGCWPGSSRFTASPFSVAVPSRWPRTTPSTRRSRRARTSRCRASPATATAT